MKKLFAVLMALVMVMGMAVVAMADVDIETDIEKDKEIDVEVETNINKNVLLTVKQLEQVDTSAEADVTKNDLIEDVEIDLEGSAAQAQLLNDAFSNAVGIININQAPGYANNQGNAVAIAYASVVDPALDAFLNAQAHVEEDLALDDNNEIDISDNVASDDTISDNAFINAVGVININQGAGVVNNQNNAVALALGTDPTASLAEADLGQDIWDADIDVEQANNIDRITLTAFQFATGVINVNQASGASNNQANVVAVTAASFGGPF